MTTTEGQFRALDDLSAASALTKLSPVSVSNSPYQPSPSSIASTRSIWDIAKIAGLSALMTGVPASASDARIETSYFSPPSRQPMPPSSFSHFEGLKAGSIEERLVQLEARTNAALTYLSWQVTQLSDHLASPEWGTAAHPVGAAGNDDDLLSPRDLRDVAGHDLVGDHWVDIFEHVADGSPLNRTDLPDFAREGLKSQDPSVRSAAARALSVLAPADVLDLVQAAIKTEENPYVAASFKSALAAARLAVTDL